MSRKNTAQVQLSDLVYAEVTLLAEDEKRSLSNMIACLLDEALETRRIQKRKAAEPKVPR